jgi:aminoglycoside 2'-N-acetyltransferase I
MAGTLLIRKMDPSELCGDLAERVYCLCDSAYGSPTRLYFEQVGPGCHLLGFEGDVLVSHLMWVTRWLEPEGRPLLRTAYVEMVATAPAFQGRGYASALLQELVAHISHYDVAALSPAREGLYTRLGWRYWRGPLAIRHNGTLVPTPEEQVMLLPLPRTPQLPWNAGLSVEWRPGEVW